MNEILKDDQYYSNGLFAATFITLPHIDYDDMISMYQDYLELFDISKNKDNYVIITIILMIMELHKITNCVFDTKHSDKFNGLRYKNPENNTDISISDNEKKLIDDYLMNYILKDEISLSVFDLIIKFKSIFLSIGVNDIYELLMITHQDENTMRKLITNFKHKINDTFVHEVHITQTYISGFLLSKMDKLQVLLISKRGGRAKHNKYLNNKLNRTMYIADCLMKMKPAQFLYLIKRGRTIFFNTVVQLDYDYCKTHHVAAYKQELTSYRCASNKNGTYGFARIPSARKLIPKLSSAIARSLHDEVKKNNITNDELKQYFTISWFRNFIGYWGIFLNIDKSTN